MKMLFALLLATMFSAHAQEADIDSLLDDWHKAAANAKFDAYFSAFADDAHFIGTDASEVWDVDAFKAFAKPYFDKGKAWDFKPVQRHIYVSADGSMAWFDETLDTWMKLCRGSGVLRKERGKWKIVHYVLSMTVPNENVKEIVSAKTEAENRFLEKLAKQ